MGFTTSTETEEGIARAIVRGKVDLQRDPWPKVSEEAKDLVKSMLDPNPYNRMTVEEVLGMYPFTYTSKYLYVVTLDYMLAKKAKDSLLNVSQAIQTNGKDKMETHNILRCRI